MLTRKDLHPYQERCVEHILDNDVSALFLDMGLGKTVSTLTAARDINEWPILVVGPKLVCETVWSQEASIWAHLYGITFSHVMGNAKQREAGLGQDAHVYIMNRDNWKWLLTQKNIPPFQMIVLDELSSYRRAGGVWVRCVHQLRKLTKARMVGLTGTPAPNGLLGLFSQIKVLDGGQRLGTNGSKFKAKYFHPIDYNEYKWMPNDGTEEYIAEQLKDIAITMRADDYLDMPDLINNPMPVLLQPSEYNIYYAMEKKKEWNGLYAANAGVLSGKLTQMASGNVYENDDDTGAHRYIHSAKTQALKGILDEAQGTPILCAYWYGHSHEALKKLGGEDVTPENIEKWNKGEIPFMLIHPASAGHGIQLQHGGHQIVWYDMIHDLELYEQTIARVHRQGQKHPVINTCLMVAGTVDEDIFSALYSKASVQDAIKARFKRLKGE